MPEESPIVITGIMARRLREQPVLRTREVWNNSDPGSGAGQALGKVFAELERQGLSLAGTVYISMEPYGAEGELFGEAVLPVNRPGRTSGDIEATTIPSTDALSTLYRDNIHLTSGQAVLWRLREHAEANGLILDGEPRWVYHTDPSWNLEPDDQLVEVLWPYHLAPSALQRPYLSPMTDNPMPTIPWPTIP